MSRRNWILNVFCGLAYASHVFLTSYSLRFMSYPIKIILHSSKLLIAMPINVFFKARKAKIPGTIFGYTLKEIIVSIAIFVGICLVLLPNNDKKKDETNPLHFQWKGVVMLVFSINLGCVFDELQSLMLVDRTDTKVVLAWNMLSSIFFLCGGVIINGLTKDFVDIICNDKKTLFLTTLMGIVNSLTQGAMILLKKKYGTWWKNIISSFRKCLSIIISILFFGHAVTHTQIVGIVFVVVCIFLAGQIEIKRKKDSPSVSVENGDGAGKETGEKKKKKKKKVKDGGGGDVQMKGRVRERTGGSRKKKR